jgi:hypothetical protein
VSEGINPQTAVGAAHDLCVASAVFDALQRIGQCGIFEAIGICQYVSHSSASQIFIVKKQFYIGQQYPGALALNGLGGVVRVDTCAPGKMMGLLFDKPFACFLGLTVETGGFFRA